MEIVLLLPANHSGARCTRLAQLRQHHVAVVSFGNQPLVPGPVSQPGRGSNQTAQVCQRHHSRHNLVWQTLNAVSTPPCPARLALILLGVRGMVGRDGFHLAPQHGRDERFHILFCPNGPGSPEIAVPKPDVVGRHLAGDAHTPGLGGRISASASLVETWHMCSRAPVDWARYGLRAVSGFPPDGNPSAERSISSAWLITVRRFFRRRSWPHTLPCSRARLCRPR